MPTSDRTQKHVLCKSQGSFCRIIYARTEIHYPTSVAADSIFCHALWSVNLAFNKWWQYCPMTHMIRSLHVRVVEFQYSKRTLSVNIFSRILCISLYVDGFKICQVTARSACVELYAASMYKASICLTSDMSCAFHVLYKLLDWFER